jgi:phosphatidylglycerophosphatase A
MRKLILFIATGAGSGYAPVAPGTFGSAVGLVLYGLLVWVSPLAFLVGTVAIIAVGVWAADHAERIFGRKDDGRIVIDEIAGMQVSLAFLPAGLGVALVGFFLFRLFDIVKPPPARGLESVQGGAGVMLDDLLAGVYANLVGQVFWRVIWPGGWL